jgi:hypothetical protein
MVIPINGIIKAVFGLLEPSRFQLVFPCAVQGKMFNKRFLRRRYMIIEASELCPSCRQVPGINGMTIEATINSIRSNREKIGRSDDEINVMIYSCLYEYKDVSHTCLRLISDRIPSYMKGR